MKILQMFAFFSPLHGGGTVDLLYKVSRSLADEGHEVVLYTSDFELDNDYINSLSGVTVHPFHCLSGLSGFYVTPELIAKARNELKGFDIIHMHCFRSFQNTIVRHYARKYNIPYIIDSHGSLPRAAADKNILKQSLKWLYDTAFGYGMLRDAAGLVAENEFSAREYQSLGANPDKITIIHPPIDINEFSNLPSPGTFRQKYGIKEKYVVLFLGRIHRVKGLDFLAESFHQLLQRRDDTALVIVGPDDGYKPKLDGIIRKLGITDRILFTGFLGGADKLSALVDADILVQPSVYEQGARPSLEAILCNTPVIVSRDTGAGEDISKIDAGYLVKHGDRAKLVDTIEYILNNPAEAAEKTKKAKEYITENLSSEKVTGQYEALYNKIIERDGRKGN